MKDECSSVTRRVTERAPSITIGLDTLRALIDSSNKLSAAETARKRGVPVEITGNYIQAAFSGIGIVTVLVAGWPGLVLGLALALLAGYFASAYKALVPLACSTWLDRCFLRRVLDNSGRGWGQIDPFEDANHEMSSLDMVFRGVTVDLLWGNTTIKQETERDSGEDDIAVLPHMRAGTGTSSIASGYPAIAIQEELAGAVEGRKVVLCVTLPKADEIYISLDLVGGIGEWEDPRDLYKYVFSKGLSDDSLQQVETGGEGGAAERNNAPTVDAEAEVYQIKIDESYTISQVGEGVRLVVEIRVNQSGGRCQDVFEVYF